MTGSRYKVEMLVNNIEREVFADRFEERDGWLFFFYRKPQGGENVRWIVSRDKVVSIFPVDHD